jgi:hypothetical protein
LDEIIVPEESSPVDPRWDKLKGLNTDN